MREFFNNKTMADITEISKATQFQTGEKQVEIARKGGIASGIAKREKKILREAVLAVIDADPTAPAAIGKALIDKARKGNLGAIDQLAKLLGEYQQEPTVQNNTQINNYNSGKTPEERYEEVYGRIEDAELLEPEKEE